ncbi:MAG: YegS/Rv2252/BmrU family lipid kinase [Microcoleaceae cyanobacterium]
MDRSTYLIFNPVSGQGDAEEELSLIKQYLESKVNLIVKHTTKEVSAEKLAQQAVEADASCIIASGGDGTVSQVAEVLIGTDIPLGVIARGTANAFANALNIPDTIKEACETILEQNQRNIDVAKCNGKLMILLAGIGFEAETVDHTSRELKDKFGILAYFLSGLNQLQELEKFEAELETDDKIIQVEAAAITVANIAPPSSILAQGPAGIVMDDGLLDVTIISPQNKLGAIAASYHLFQSAANENEAQRDDIGYLRTRKITIKTNPQQKVAVDGEMEGTTPLEIECLPKELMVLVPRHLSEESPEKLEGLPGLKVKKKQSKTRENSEEKTENKDLPPIVDIIDKRKDNLYSFKEDEDTIIESSQPEIEIIDRLTEQ